MKNNLNEYFGIIMYSIESNGCLNGLWTENSKFIDKNEIMNGIAKQVKATNKTDSLLGEYKDSYIDKNNKEIIICTGKLIINYGKNDKFYILKWYNNENILEYIGKGFKIGDNLIATYWENK